MNEKNKRKRRSVTLDNKWHQKFKILAAFRQKKIEDVMDAAAVEYLKHNPVPQK